MAIKNFELKVDVQKSALDVLVSSNLPCFIQMICGLGSLYNELYPIDEKKIQYPSHWKWTWILGLYM